jgi:hypothetical protein
MQSGKIRRFACRSPGAGIHATPATLDAKAVAEGETRPRTTNK